MNSERISLVSILKWALDVGWYLLWGALVVAGAAMALTMAFFLMSLFGIAPEALREALQRLDALKILALPVVVVDIITLLVLIDRLRRMFATLMAGDPFVPENAGHLRVIALAVAAYQVIGYVMQGIVAMVLTLFGQPVAEEARVTVDLYLNFGAWLAVVALFVLSEVFREGARMRQEQKLTI